MLGLGNRADAVVPHDSLQVGKYDALRRATMCSCRRGAPSELIATGQAEALDAAPEGRGWRATARRISRGAGYKAVGDGAAPNCRHPAAVRLDASAVGIGHRARLSAGRSHDLSPDRWLVGDDAELPVV